MDVKDQKVEAAQKKTQDNPATRSSTSPPKKCPFCVGAPEVPEPFDVMILPNRFSGLDMNNKEAFTLPRVDSPYQVAPAMGLQEIVLFSPEHDKKLGDLSVDQVTKIVKAWKEQYVRVGAMPDIQYIYQFENRGSMIGVSLSHPHGQMYAFSWIPLYIMTELQSFKEYHAERKRCLLCDIVAEEKRNIGRIIKENENFVEVAPFYAMWPHEVHLYPKKHVQSLADLDDRMMADFAGILKDVNQRYDRLYPGIEFAFVMAIHQKPTSEGNYDYYHFHVDFYPPLRKADQQKFAAGVELGTGAWINSTLPERSAEMMRAIKLD